MGKQERGQRQWSAAIAENDPLSRSYLSSLLVCRRRALRFHSLVIMSAIFACCAACFRADLVNGKLFGLSSY